MKKLLAILLAGIMLLALSGCSNGTAEDELITADSSVTLAPDVTDEALATSETDAESEITEDITSDVEEIEETPEVATTVATTEAEEVVNIWADIDGEDVPGIEINNGRAGLTLVEGSVTSTGVTFILHNYVTYVEGVDGELEFGYYVRWLQVYENGEWCDVINDYEEDVITPADAAYIEEDGEYQFTVNWGSTYGELPAGHYRYLMRGEYYKEDSFFVACGFDIE